MITGFKRERRGSGFRVAVQVDHSSWGHGEAATIRAAKKLAKTEAERKAARRPETLVWRAE